MSVVESHGSCDCLEAAIRSDVGDALITVYAEPKHKAKQAGVPVP